MPNYWFDHIHFTSPDVFKTAQFYERMFNAKRVSVKEFADGRINLALDLNDRSRIALTRPAEPENFYGLNHLGLGTDNLEAAVAELKAKGVQFKEEPRVSQPSGIKISFLWAPENALIELVQRPS